MTVEVEHGLAPCKSTGSACLPAIILVLERAAVPSWSGCAEIWTVSAGAG